MKFQSFYLAKLGGIMALLPVYLYTVGSLIENPFHVTLVGMFTVVAALGALFYEWVRKGHRTGGWTRQDPLSLVAEALFLVVYHFGFTLVIADTIPRPERFANAYTWSMLFLLFHVVFTVFTVRRAVRGEDMLPIAGAGLLLDNTTLFSRPLDVASLGPAFQWGVVLVFALKILEGWTPGHWQRLKSIPLLMPMLAVAMLGALGTAFAPNPGTSLAEALHFARYFGIFFLWIFSLRREESLRSHFHFLALSYGSLAVLGAVQFAFNVSNFSLLYAFRKRLWIFGLHPNVQAAGVVVFLLPLLGWALALYLREKGDAKAKLLPWVYLAVSAGLLWTLMFTFSKGGVGSVALAAALLAALHGLLKGWEGVKTKTVLLSGIVGAVLLLIGAALWAAPRIDLLRDPLKSSTLGMRAVIYQTCLHSIMENPMVGQGLMNHRKFARFAPLFEGDAANRFAEWIGYGNRGGHCHNAFLEIATATGLGGFLAALWFFVVFVREGIQSVRKLSGSRWYPVALGALGGGMAIGMNGLTDYPFGLSAPCVGLLFLAAVIRFSRDSGAPESAPSEAPPFANPILQRWNRPGYYLLAALAVLVVCVLQPCALSLVRFGSSERLSWLPESVFDRARAAVQLSYLDAALMGNYAKILNETESFADSRREYRGALDYDAGNPAFYAGVADTLKKEKKYAGAAVAYEQAVKADPAGLIDGEHYTDLAWATLQLGDTSKVRDSLRQAFLTDPLAVKKIRWGREYEIMGIVPAVRMDFPEFTAEEFLGSFVQEYVQLREANNPRSRGLLEKVTEMYWTLGQFSQLSAMIHSHGLHPLIPVNKWPLVTDTLLRWSDARAPQPKPSAAQRYEELLATAARQHEEHWFETSISSLLVAVDTLPEDPRAYKMLARYCAPKNHLEGETRYFQAYAEMLEGKGDR